MVCCPILTPTLPFLTKAPKDRRPISTDDLLEAPPPTELTQKPVRDNSPEETNDICSGSSAKIDQLIHLLQLTPSTEKSLVFSQFTSFLDKVCTYVYPCYFYILILHPRLKRH